MNRRKYWWSANNQTFVLIEDMSDQHLMNSILYIQRNFNEKQYFACISLPSLLREYMRRSTCNNATINVFTRIYYNKIWEMPE